jgi:hypothetical protein
MIVRFAKRNPVKGTITAYVQSETDRRKRYIVQLVTRGRKTLAFCECKDFIARHLPHIHTNTFSSCKHGKRALKARRAA